MLYPHERCREHLISNVPNQWWAHLLIRYLNRRMRKANSRYFLEKRYRKPRRRGARRWYRYSLPRKAARRFSVYLKEHPQSVRARHRALERERMRQAQIERLREVH